MSLRLSKLVRNPQMLSVIAHTSFYCGGYALDRSVELRRFHSQATFTDNAAIYQAGVYATSANRFLVISYVGSICRYERPGQPAQHELRHALELRTPPGATRLPRRLGEACGCKVCRQTVDYKGDGTARRHSQSPRSPSPSPSLA